MKKIVFILLVMTCVNCSSVKETYSDGPYNIDEVLTEINDYLQMVKNLESIKPSDSANAIALKKRKHEGKILEFNNFIKVFKELHDINYNDDHSIAIVYHHGQNQCAATGTRDRTIIRKKYGKLKKGLEILNQTKLYYLFDNDSGLSRYEGIIPWKKDSLGFIKDLLISEESPCGSFVVISQSGEYLVSNGEWSIANIWATANYLNMQNDH